VLRRPRFVVLMASLMSLSVLFPASTLAAAPTLNAWVVQSGLVIPWDLAFAPTGEMIVTERPGRVKVFAGGQAGADLLASSTISNVHASGEAGAMGVAVDHNFASNRFIYVCVSRDYQGEWLNQVIRYRLTAGWHLDFSKYIIRLGMHANTIHNGCALQEGPDHKLWVTMGDGGDAMRAQNPNRLNGKVLRVNRDGSIPSGNPIWPGHSNPTRVYSIGHRNPQGIAFHPENGRVYAVEHGPDVDDEINWIRPGRNYGWPCVTGRNNPYMSCSGDAHFSFPAWSSEGPTLATSGGVFVDGSSWEGWNDDLFVCSLKQEDLRRFTIESDGQPATQRNVLFNGRWGRLRAAVLGPGNKLYLTTSNGSNDKIIRITPS
jgi:glucose/arabinose dehydrogenase